MALEQTEDADVKSPERPTGLRDNGMTPVL
jgi:hypothetical protein